MHRDAGGDCRAGASKQGMHPVIISQPLNEGARSALRQANGYHKGPNAFPV